MCNHLSNLLPFKASSTSFLQRGTTFPTTKKFLPIPSQLSNVHFHTQGSNARSNPMGTPIILLKTGCIRFVPYKKDLYIWNLFTIQTWEQLEAWHYSPDPFGPLPDSLCSEKQFFASAQHMQPCHAARARSHTPLPVARSPSVASPSWERHSFRPS